MVEDVERFRRAIALFDDANAADTRADAGPDGLPCPRELLYAQRMTEMLGRFAPHASEVAKLAVRAQHIERWRTPRDGYPMDRDGYLRWRSALYAFHAGRAGALMEQAGYGEDAIEQVRRAIGKRGRKVNPDAQLVEDCASLVFIEHYLAEFAARKRDYSEEKWLGILRKTWDKMSRDAREFALSGNVRLPDSLLPLITKAVAAGRAAPAPQPPGAATFRR
jgi:hypothetical protein